MSAGMEKLADGDGIAYSPIAMQHNAMIITYCRTSVAALSGCAAGILGLTALFGFAFYLLTSAFLSILMVMKAGGRWQRYFLSRSALIYGGVFGELTTYILFWTFIYGMVHVY